VRHPLKRFLPLRRVHGCPAVLPLLREQPADRGGVHPEEARRLGYLEVGTEDVVATGHDPLRDDAPELAQPLAA
jgi:hypothetical protein